VNNPETLATLGTQDEY